MKVNLKRLCSQRQQIKRSLAYSKELTGRTDAQTDNLRDGRMWARTISQRESQREGEREGDRQASRTCGAARQEVGSGGDDDDDDEADADENMRLKLTTKRWCRSEGEEEQQWEL